MDKSLESTQVSMSGAAYIRMIESAHSIGLTKGFVTGFWVAENSSTMDFKNVVSDGKIESLPSDCYEVISSIDVKFQYTDDEVLALQTDLELYGEGKNQFEAINELKLEILDLAEDLFDTPDAELGKHPKAWKKAIIRMLKKCQ
ncbi:MAG: hypothetical protein HQ517_03000 [SAR324 cluster bacterium]|nr:hypothetical protein [SAR324 cluster bacterium]